MFMIALAILSAIVSAVSAVSASAAIGGPDARWWSAAALSSART